MSKKGVTCQKRSKCFFDNVKQLLSTFRQNQVLWLKLLLSRKIIKNWQNGFYRWFRASEMAHEMKIFLTKDEQLWYLSNVCKKQFKLPKEA